jgi:trigger factor
MSEVLVSVQKEESLIHSKVGNENLSVSITKNPHCQVKFEIEVSSTATEAVYEQAVKSVSKSLTIPGFRKGRAPRSFILEKYRDSIQKEFVDIVLRTGFNDAIQLSGIHPLKEGIVKRPVIYTCDRANGARFAIEFECRPEIMRLNFEDIKLKKIVPASVTDQEEQNVLQNLALQLTTYDPIQDRPVEDWDFVDLDFDLLEPTQEISRHQRVQVHPSQLSSWVCKHLVGLKAGESVEGMTEQDPAFTSPGEDFQPRPFRATVQAIWKGNLPAVDDELAKRLNVSSLEDLREQIRQRLNKENEDAAEKLEVEQLENVLLEKYPIDLPQSYVEADKEMYVNDYIKKLEAQHIPYSHEDLRRINEQIEKMVLRRLQLMFLFYQIAHDFNIQINQEDVSEEMIHQLSLIPYKRQTVNFSQDKKSLREELERVAFEKKIQQFLIDRATFID